MALKIFGVRSSAVIPLVLHHDYRRGDANDLSGRGHHGIVVDAARDQITPQDGLLLDGRTGRVIVPPSLTLAGMRSIRVSVTARLSELRERSNLVEGYLSFALLVHGDGSVQGGSYDGSTWVSVRSGPRLLRTGEWDQITFTCRPDLGTLLYVGADLVASTRLAPDELNPVSWPFGLNVGGWPDADSFMMKGHIRDLLVWAEEVTIDGQPLLDHDPDDPARTPTLPDRAPLPGGRPLP